MNWKLFDLQGIIDELFVDDWLYPWGRKAVGRAASQ